MTAKPAPTTSVCETPTDACQEYNEKVGPLTIMDVDVSSWWNWVEGPWPWEGGAC